MTKPKPETTACDHIELGAPIKARAMMEGLREDGTSVTMEVLVCAKCLVPLLDKVATKSDAQTEITLSFDEADAS